MKLKVLPEWSGYFTQSSTVCWLCVGHVKCYAVLCASVKTGFSTLTFFMNFSLVVVRFFPTTKGNLNKFLFQSHTVSTCKSRCSSTFFVPNSCLPSSVSLSLSGCECAYRQCMRKLCRDDDQIGFSFVFLFTTKVDWFATPEFGDNKT